MKAQLVQQRSNRPKIWIRLFLVVAVMGLLVDGFNQRLSHLPPLGSLLSPFHGIWAHTPSIFERKSGEHVLALSGLRGKVTIQVDQDQVKHIFAENDEDLYFAQGYVVASDRLWQMDFMTRIAGGRLSEVVGHDGLEYDRLFVRLGVPQAAKESLDLMLQDALTGPAIQAYTRGVNAYIDGLTAAKLPFEYKLLGHRPEPWTPFRAALLMKFMAYQLSHTSFDLPLSRSFARLGPVDFDDLFALEASVPEPIVPRGTKWNVQTETPAMPASLFQANIKKQEPYPLPHPSNGSNNWAVMGKKSVTGRPILSNDIHLNLSLPSLWYQIQLKSPSQNVYGVTLPGAPGVILGFNSRLAWGVTNGESDVLDWYELRFRDEHKNEYLFDGGWRPVISQEVEIKVRGEKPQNVTFRRTHFGPIVYDDNESPLNPNIPKGLAMRWAALEASNELKSFMLLNRAQSTEECREAINEFVTPDQNFLCADNKDDVGLWHMGRYPLRWRGQGRMISDGSSADYEWKGWIPRDEIPSVRNPDRGFVSSANQNPTDETYPHYLGWSFDSPFRSMRINELLRAKEKFSPEDMIRMQMDTLSISARMALPSLLDAMKGAKLVDDEKEALSILGQWDYRYEENSKGATIFYAWYKALENKIWSSRFPDQQYYMYPPKMRTIQLIEREPNSRWFDDPSTPTVETLRDLAHVSFLEALEVIRTATGSSRPSQWTWAQFRPTQFAHVGKIPGLGAVDLPARGMETSVFANSGIHGPVWKTVVALGEKPRAWGVYPGGQSGDPASRYYDNFMESWRNGEMNELVYLMSPQEQGPRHLSTWVLEAKK